MLAAEDYHLSVTGTATGPVRLTVAAGACSYCLVPKSTLHAVALDHLTRAGLPSELTLEIVYLEDASD